MSCSASVKPGGAVARLSGIGWPRVFVVKNVSPVDGCQPL